MTDLFHFSAAPTERGTDTLDAVMAASLGAAGLLLTVNYAYQGNLWTRAPNVNVGPH